MSFAASVIEDADRIIADYKERGLVLVERVDKKMPNKTVSFMYFGRKPNGKETEES